MLNLSSAIIGSEETPETDQNKSVISSILILLPQSVLTDIQLPKLPEILTYRLIVFKCVLIVEPSSSKSHTK